MKSIALLIILAFIFTGCKKDEVGCLLIRIENSSGYKYKNIVVNTGGGEKEYENLKSSKKSTYKSFESAYQYAFIELEIDGKTYTIQPLDYSGETQLPQGKYTYKVDANESEDQYGKLSLTFIED